jgi:hypothetical protein
MVSEECSGQLHVLQKERIKIIIMKMKKNGAKTISFQTLLGRFKKTFFF